MQYFILLPGDRKENLHYESNLLGDHSGFGTFWPGQGLEALMNISKNKPELLEQIEIIDERGKGYTIENFLELLQKFEIKSKKS